MVKGKAKTLTVIMNGVLVGQLARRAKGIISFGYDEAWLSGRARSPLPQSLPLTSQVYSGNRVENYFDDMTLRHRLRARVGLCPPGPLNSSPTSAGIVWEPCNLNPKEKHQISKGSPQIG